jgi:hypothetical protein
MLVGVITKADNILGKEGAGPMKVYVVETQKEPEHVIADAQIAIELISHRHGRSIASIGTL